MALQRTFLPLNSGYPEATALKLELCLHIGESKRAYYNSETTHACMKDFEVSLCSEL